MQLLAATDEFGFGRQVGVVALRLLQVIDVLDLRVRADAVVVATEVGLPVGEENGLVLGAAERGQGEVPPLREQERADEDEGRDPEVAQEVAVGGDPPREASASAARVYQRVGLGETPDGRTVGATVGAAVGGGAVAAGIWPDLNCRIAVATLPSSRRFSM